MRLYYVIKENKTTNECYVVLKYKYKSKQIDLSPKVKVKKSNFGDGKSDNPIKRGDIDFLQKNHLLRIFKEDVNQIIFRLQNEGVEPLVEMVKNQHLKLSKEQYIKSKIPTESTSYLVSFIIEKYLKSVTNTAIGKEVNSTTINVNLKETPYSKSVRSRFEHIKKFISDNYQNKLEFYEIVDEFYIGLQNYLISLKLSNSTISKIISQFRQFVRWAQKNNYTKGGDTSYRFNLPTNYKSINYLTPEEIKILKNFNQFNYHIGKNTLNSKVDLFYKNWKEKDYILSDELKNAKVNNKGVVINCISTNKFRNHTTYEVIKDMFLFGIATGLRWGDLVTMKVINYDYDLKLFTRIQEKTKSKVKIVENELSEEIYRKYVYRKCSLQYIFPLPCSENDISRKQYNTKANIHIKEICKIIGLKRKVENISMNGDNVVEEKVNLYSIVSFHMSRRTHSTIGIQSGVDLYSMSNQMGHKGVGMNSRYVGADNQKLQNMFGFLYEENESLQQKNEEPENEDKIEYSNYTLEEKVKKLSEWKELYEKGVIPQNIYEDEIRKIM